MRESFFSRFVGPVIDKVLGLRCTSFGYQYGETEKYDAKMTTRIISGVLIRLAGIT